MPDPIQDCRDRCISDYQSLYAAAFAQYNIDFAACNGNEACEAAAQDALFAAIQDAYEKFVACWNGCDPG